MKKIRCVFEDWIATKGNIKIIFETLKMSRNYFP